MTSSCARSLLQLVDIGPVINHCLTVTITSLSNSISTGQNEYRGRESWVERELGRESVTERERESVCVCGERERGREKERERNGRNRVHICSVRLDI